MTRTVDLSVSDVSVTEGNTAAGSDDAGTMGHLTFVPGTTTQTVPSQRGFDMQPTVGLYWA